MQYIESSSKVVQIGIQLRGIIECNLLDTDIQIVASFSTFVSSAIRTGVVLVCIFEDDS